MAGTSGTKSVQAKDEMPLMKKRIETMSETAVPALTPQCCIFKVPTGIRMVKESAYTPSVISIGPFHHQRGELQLMQKQKGRYLDHVVNVYKVSLEGLLAAVKDSEESIRKCYDGERIDLSSDEFVTMVLLDGVFIVEYLRRRGNRMQQNENDTKLNIPRLRNRMQQNENDTKVYNSRLQNSIRNDLILFENQLPFFVLESLYKLIAPSDQRSFRAISYRFFNMYNQQGIQPLSFLHFTDLIRKFHLLPRKKPSVRPENNKVTEHSAKDLEQSGINFKETSSTKCLFDISFDVNNGVLQVPRLVIEDNTESIFRNMMALEQCVYEEEMYICDYTMLMDTLINTPDDVQVLAENGIIENRRGDHGEVAAFFNNLNRGITHDVNVSYFNELKQELDRYYKKRWHKWMAILKREYLSTPWKLASIIAAFILLVLTFIQTICSIIQVLP